MKFGIIGAMDVEVQSLVEKMTSSHVKTHGSRNYYEGVLCGCECVVVQCGIGKVNATLCTQTLIDLFEVDAIINTGIAGGVAPEVHIGDMVVAQNVVQHDFDLSVFGYERGHIPGFSSSFFEASRDLVHECVEILKPLADEFTLHTGTVATGDVFVCTSEQKNMLYQDFSALCCEMEGGAIGQVCTVAGVPFTILRCISDQANGLSVNDYPQFEIQMAHRCAQVVCEFLERQSD